MNFSKKIWLTLLTAAFVAGCPAPHPTDGSADGTTDAVRDTVLDAPADMVVDTPTDMGLRCDAAGTMMCSGRCVDTMTDSMNCGGCGTACPAGMGCVGGSCSVVCPTGQIMCSGMCVTIAT